VRSYAGVAGGRCPSAARFLRDIWDREKGLGRLRWASRAAFFCQERRRCFGCPPSSAMFFHHDIAGEGIGPARWYVGLGVEAALPMRTGGGQFLRDALAPGAGVFAELPLPGRCGDQALGAAL